MDRTPNRIDVIGYYGDEELVNFSALYIPDELANHIAHTREGVTGWLLSQGYREILDTRTVIGCNFFDWEESDELTEDFEREFPFEFRVETKH